MEQLRKILRFTSCAAVSESVDELAVVYPDRSNQVPKRCFLPPTPEHDSKDSSKGLDAYRQLNDLIFPAFRSRELFAYAFGRQCLEQNRFVAEGWDVYDATAEYHRQNIVNNGWRISAVNEDYSFCDTYPSLLAVPVDVSDDLLIQSAPHRANFRVPVLSWLHPESRASLTRASQPMVGLQNRRNSADEQLVELIRTANANTSDLLILDARSQVSNLVLFSSLFTLVRPPIVLSA
ncbi:unnamed protein product [Schistocephalus solidus]|uniref:Myotubularin phosphatase domain-containing protein n=1 Tax=Schistocephalus solidus TaxID=70667 RepID=A0A183SA26_SCHSO|nr:unnamed protein product [Schistocephalus solidus]